MKTRVLHTRFWKDDYISRLNPKEKLVFVYLLTNENINMCGAYELPDRYICFDLGITQKELAPIKDMLERDNKFMFRNGWVLVRNHNKYNSYGVGKTQEKALLRETSMIPGYLNDTSIHTSMDTTQRVDIIHKSETIIQNTEIINQNTELRKKDFSQFSDLTETVMAEIAEKYGVSLETVENRKMDMEVWLGRSSKNHYDNYKLALMKWVRDSSNKFTKGGAYGNSNNKPRSINGAEILRTMGSMRERKDIHS